VSESLKKCTVSGERNKGTTVLHLYTLYNVAPSRCNSSVMSANIVNTIRSILYHHMY
jgi:hypothetical protein